MLLSYSLTEVRHACVELNTKLTLSVLDLS